VAFALAVPGLRRALGERRPGATWLALHGLGTLAFALCVHLPLSNEHKFAFLVFVPLALLGAGALPGAAATAERRWGRARAVAVAAVLFGTTPALTLAGFLADPTGATDPRVTLSAEEAALYRWIREETPLDAVFVDDRSRDLVMVHGRRRMLAGTTFGPELAAFPAAALAARRAAQADLYGPVARLDEDVATLRGAGGRAFVVFRDADRASGAEPWRALDADPRFSLRFRAGGFHVYALEALP
jgi:hypothetical protein